MTDITNEYNSEQFLVGDEVVSLGRHAAKLKNWKWMAGMQIHYIGPKSICIPSYHGRMITAQRARLLSDREPRNLETAFPDFSDPATVGCLYHLVCEAYKTSFIHFVYDNADGEPDYVKPSWKIFSDVALFGSGPSLAKALVNALEMSP